MKYIRNDSTDPFYNLAFEEYTLHNLKDDDYVLLWQNAPVVVIGKHQNAAEEVDLKRAAELGVKIVRRNTGGGAVYHDMGNLNFSFITDWAPEKDVSYDAFLEPVIRALAAFGVDAARRGRNDLVVGDRKISGNAQCIHGGRLLHHGTLLVDSDLSVLPEVLRVADDKIVSKGIKSVRSRVANINEFTEDIITPAALKEALVGSFFSGGAVGEHVPDGVHTAEAERIAGEKYGTWEWNVGSSPDYSYKNARRFPGGGVEVRLEVKNGVITACKIYGDFLAIVGVEELENAVVGCRQDESELEKALKRFELPQYYGFTLAELIECFE